MQRKKARRKEKIEHTGAMEIKWESFSRKERRMGLEQDRVADGPSVFKVVSGKREVEWVTT